MNIQIESIQYGLDKHAVLLEASFGEKPFFSDEYCIKLLLKDSETNLLDTVEVCLAKSEYTALGATEEARLDAILASKGIVKVIPEEI